MSVVRQVVLLVLGVIVIAAAVMVWNYATGTMTSLVEDAWCTIIAKGGVPISRVPALPDLDDHRDRQLAHPGFDHRSHRQSLP